MFEADDKLEALSPEDRSFERNWLFGSGKDMRKGRFAFPHSERFLQSKGTQGRDIV